MKRFFRKLSYFLATVVIILLLAGVVIQLVIGESVKSAIIKRINASINSKLEVAGDIDFSVFRSFPYFSVNFNDVTLKENKSFGEKDLLTAKQVALQFNVWTILKKNYTINRIKIKEGKLYSRVDNKGNRNYLIFNSVPGKGGDDTEIKIDKILLDNVEVFFDDEKNNQHYAVNIHSATLSGNFSASKFVMDITTNMLVEKLDIDGVKYLGNKEVTLTTGLDVNLDNNIYSFKNSNLAVGNSEFIVNGTVSEQKEDYLLDIAVEGKRTGIAELASLLPDIYNRKLSDLDSKGNLSFTGTIKGPLSATKNPQVNFVFDVKKTTIKHKPSGQKVNNVSFIASYNNGLRPGWANSVLKIEQGKATFNGKPFSIEMSLSQFNRPMLTMQVNGTVDMKTLAPFIGAKEGTDVSGEIELNNFYYKGLLNQLGNEKALATQASGSIKLVNISWKNKDTDLSAINAVLVSKQSHLQVPQFSMRAGSSDVSASGEFYNLIPFLFTRLSDSTYYPSNAFTYDLNISCNRLNTADFKSTSATGAKSSGSVLPSLLACGSGKADLKIKNYHNDKFTGNNISCNLTVKDKEIYFTTLNIDALEGNLLANGSIDLKAKNNIVLECTINCRNVNISRLFIEFNNFDQQTITDKNIKGILTTKCYVKAYWKNGVFIEENFRAIADVTIEKGELNNFKPLFTLSRFIKVQDLENIRFSKLSNQVEIKNSTVYIPSTSILTSVLNLELSGNHTFNNIIDYRIKLNFLQLLSAKYRSNNNFDPEATGKDASGQMYLYIIMTGPADNPVIRYDKKSVKAVIKTNIKQEGSDLKNILKNEFSKEQTKQDKVKDWSPPEEYEMIDFGSDTTKTN